MFACTTENNVKIIRIKGSATRITNTEQSRCTEPYVTSIEFVDNFPEYCTFPSSDNEPLLFFALFSTSSPVNRYILMSSDSRWGARVVKSAFSHYLGFIGLFPNARRFPVFSAIIPSFRAVDAFGLSFVWLILFEWKTVL